MSETHGPQKRETAVDRYFEAFGEPQKERIQSLFDLKYEVCFKYEPCPLYPLGLSDVAEWGEFDSRKEADEAIKQTDWSKWEAGRPDTVWVQPVPPRPLPNWIQ